MRALVTSALCLVFAVFFLTPCFAEDWIGQIKNGHGPITIERAGTSRIANVGDFVYEKDHIVSGSDSGFGITFRDGCRMTAGANSTLVIDVYQFNASTGVGKFVASLPRGTLLVVAGQIAAQGFDAMIVGAPIGQITTVKGSFFVRADDSTGILPGVVPPALSKLPSTLSNTLPW